MSEENLTQSVDDMLQKALRAAAVFNQLDQAYTDRIVRAVYEAGFNARVRLAKLAHEETKIGKWRDKVIKNVKTVGILSDDRERGIVEIAQPMGPILAVTRSASSRMTRTRSSPSPCS